MRPKLPGKGHNIVFNYEFELFLTLKGQHPDYFSTGMTMSDTYQLARTELGFRFL